MLMDHRGLFSSFSFRAFHVDADLYTVVNIDVELYIDVGAISMPMSRSMSL